MSNGRQSDPSKRCHYKTPIRPRMGWGRPSGSTKKAYLWATYKKEGKDKLQ